MTRKFMPVRRIHEIGRIRRLRNQDDLPPRKPTPQSGLPEKPAHAQVDALKQSVKRSLDSAHEQVERSRALVAHSREILGRVRRSLAHAVQIQHGIAQPSLNPIIPIVPGSTGGDA